MCIYVYTINQSLKNLAEEQLVNFLLFSSEKFTLDTNVNILRRTIKISISNRTL